jgi:hypothetical protein
VYGDLGHAWQRPAIRTLDRREIAHYAYLRKAAGNSQIGVHGQAAEFVGVGVRLCRQRPTKSTRRHASSPQHSTRCDALVAAALLAKGNAVSVDSHHHH